MNECQQYYESIMKVILDCLIYVYASRPTCNDILGNEKNWAMPFPVVKDKIIQIVNTQSKYKFSTQFVKHVLQAKYNEFNMKL